jgi:hypothetical protein
MTLKHKEIAPNLSWVYLLPNPGAVVTCELGSMITTITRRLGSPGGLAVGSL